MHIHVHVTHTHTHARHTYTHIRMHTPSPDPDLSAIPESYFMDEELPSSGEDGERREGEGSREDTEGFRWATGTLTSLRMH